jgi:two-component system response regulator AtoC
MGFVVQTLKQARSKPIPEVWSSGCMLLKRESRSDDLCFADLQKGSQSLLGPCVSEAMRSIEAMIADLADTDIPVMVVGETGTGKEVVGLTIHRLSKRRDGTFIKIRCSAIRPEDFSQWFRADVSGGFTSRTLFLDEVAEMSPTCQTRLLEALGGTNSEPDGIQSGLSLISTTGQDLDHTIGAGQFRQDLYYRLSGFCLRLPPLRQRTEDILPLANFFLDKYSSLFGRPRPELTDRMAQTLTGYSWPGNVRELEYAVKRLVALGDERLAWKDLTEVPKNNPGTGPEREGRSLKQAARAASRQAERELILKVLAETKWNRKRAAEELRISYKALLYKLKQISQEEFTPRAQKPAASRYCD